MKTADKFKLICVCGKDITDESEEGVNDSIYYECDCGRAYNIIFSEVEE
jgi:hypothetical protein